MEKLIKSILAGLMIGLGGIICLSLDNKIIGAFLFSIGLFMIVTYKFNLFTGKVGYLITKEVKIKESLIILFGNFIGTFILGYAIRYTRISSKIIQNAQTIVDIKLNDNLISILILSICCGLLMYLCVNGYKVFEHQVAKYLGVFLAVTVFILSGFEHCIANMFYFSVANAWTTKTLLYILIMIIGNTLGSFIIPLANKVKK